MHDTRCLHTGEPVVDEIWYPESAPLERAPSEADIYIEWRGTPLGFEHPVGGRIGPCAVVELERMTIEAAPVLHHEWQPGDVVMFDNRILLHRREPGSHTGTRRLRRVVLWPRRGDGSAGPCVA